MTTQADIKLVIDRLINIDCTYSRYNKVSINEAINALETLGNQVAKQAERIKELEEMESVSLVVTQMKKIAAQAVEITKLREYFQARAIEQAVMAKLRKQKPVAWKDTTFTSDENEAMTSEPVLLGYEGWESLPDGTELFTNPAPIAPEVFIPK